MQRAEREGNLEKASQLKYGVLPALQEAGRGGVAAGGATGRPAS